MRQRIGHLDVDGDLVRTRLVVGVGGDKGVRRRGIGDLERQRGGGDGAGAGWWCAKIRFCISSTAMKCFTPKCR